MEEKEIESLIYETLNSDKPSRGVLIKAEAEMDLRLVRKKTQAKHKNAFQKLFLSSKRGIAVLTACILLFVTIPVGVWFINSGGLDMMRTLSLLRNTMVDMDNVTAFGIMETGGKNGETSTTPVRSMSIRGTVEQDEADLRDWESDYDWDPNKAQLLVTISEDGEIEEVIYERVNGRGAVRQDKLGHVVGLYVGTEFTYVMYASSLPDWYLIQDIIHGGAYSFGSHHADYQTIIIHNETGKVYPLKDLIPAVDEIVGVKQYTLWVQPFDGVLCVPPLYGALNGNIDLHFKLRIDENHNLIYENITQKDVHIRNVKRDKYGNFFMLNRTLNQKTGDTLFFTQSTPLYFGADRRVYSMDDGCLQVYNADFELEDVPETYETTLEEIWPYIDLYNSHVLGNGQGEPIATPGINPGEVYILRNGYMFSMFGKVYKLGESGRLEYLKQLQGKFPQSGEDGYILNGELVAFVTQNGAGKVIHIDFSGFTETDTYVKVMEIIEADRIFCNGLYMIGRQGADLVFEGTKYFMIVIEDGEPACEWIAYYDELTLLKPVKPIIAAWPLYAR